MKNTKPWLAFLMPNDNDGDTDADGAGAGGGAGADGKPAGDGGGEKPPAGDKGDKDGDGDNDGADGFKSPEAKQRVLADLVSVRAENKMLSERLQALEDKGLTPEDKAARDKAAREKQAADTVTGLAAQTARADRLEVALELGLPKSWAPRLQGNTIEELMADGKTVQADLKAQDGRHTPGAGTAGGNAAPPTTPGMGTLRAAYDAEK